MGSNPPFGPRNGSGAPIKRALLSPYGHKVRDVCPYRRRSPTRFCFSARYPGLESAARGSHPESLLSTGNIATRMRVHWHGTTGDGMHETWTREAPCTSPQWVSVCDKPRWQKRPCDQPSNKHSCGRHTRGIFSKWLCLQPKYCPILGSL